MRPVEFEDDWGDTVDDGGEETGAVETTAVLMSELGLLRTDEHSPWIWGVKSHMGILVASLILMLVEC